MAGFLLHAFDPTQAKASGLRGGLLHYGMLCMIALTIVATLQSVGIILSISLLIAPGRSRSCWYGALSTPCCWRWR